MLANHLTKVLDAAPVNFAYLFGSRTRDDHRRDSDLDIAVMPIGELDLLEQSRLAGQIDDALGPVEVDLVLLGDASLELRARIVRQGKLVYSRNEPDRVAFQVKTLGEFFDFEPTLRFHERRLIHQFATKGLG